MESRHVINKNIKREAERCPRHDQRWKNEIEAGGIVMHTMPSILSRSKTPAHAADNRQPWKQEQEQKQKQKPTRKTPERTRDKRGRFPVHV